MVIFTTLNKSFIVEQSRRTNFIWALKIMRLQRIFSHLKHRYILNGMTSQYTNIRVFLFSILLWRTNSRHRKNYLRIWGYVNS